MAKERILIAVKTYPTLSTTYTELVCTAGFREDGSWIRIYPSPFRFLEKDSQYAKYDWIELDIDKNPKDPRPESFRPKNIDEINVVGSVSTGKRRDWADRRRLVLGKNKVHTNLESIITAAKKNEYSLAIFKPTEITQFIAEEVDRDWEISRKQAAEAALSQGSLFEESDHSDFKLMPKLPYKFSYRFRDDVGKKSTLMIEDWEIGQLYWSCLKNHDEKTAITKVKEMYFDNFARTKDLHLFLGTTHEAHIRKFNNPYVIIGTFHPPHVKQDSLF
ncbi:MAG: hypothetical protein ACO1PZ_11770 [Gammaproteobacteria bacterium]